MRLSSSQYFFRSIDAMMEMQRNSGKYSQQISSGKRVLKPSDDPLAAANILGINQRIAGMDQFERNFDSIESHLDQQETVVTSVSNALQRIRDLVVQGKSTTLNDTDRRSIATEIRERRDELVDLGNTRDSSGEYIFSGTAVNIKPFTSDLTGAVVYNGDQTVRQIQISETRKLDEGLSGHDVFMAVRNGNGRFVTNIAAANTGTGRIVPGSLVDPSVYQAHDFRIVFTAADTFDVIDDTLAVTVLAAQPYVDDAAITFNGVSNSITGTPAAGDEFLVRPSQNQSIFQTVDNLIRDLETPLTNPQAAARFQFNLDRAFEDIDQGLNKALDVLASNGARYNVLDSQRSSNGDLSDRLKITRSRLEDVDTVEAISLLARETDALEAAQATFVRINGLSLFNFL